MRQALARVTSILAIPYGYTVTLWCAGALIVADHGFPTRMNVLLFAAGAVGGFVLLGLIGRAHLDDQVPMRVPATVVANVFPIVVALVLVSLPLRVLSKALAYPTASFVATVVYLLSLALVVRASAPPR